MRLRLTIPIDRFSVFGRLARALPLPNPDVINVPPSLQPFLHRRPSPRPSTPTSQSPLPLPTLAMRFHFSILSLAVLVGFALAAPLASTDLAARESPDGRPSADYKRSEIFYA
ncbi:hypothetical protein C8Q73DRAFT_702544 [Cubamyces lactineus]|nr:hypothetical protein C8Q73DRAFT_702544 [Cubamyces lactineus]